MDANGAMSAPTNSRDRNNEMRRLRKENREMRAALLKIVGLYVKAPGYAAPLPTTKLVWGMYQVAVKASAPKSRES